MNKESLSEYLHELEEIAVRVTPQACRNLVKRDGDLIRVYVTVPPENGKATAMVQKLLAKELGIAKSKLVLIRGATSREKVCRIG